jgi:hypothetical protein
VWSKGILTPSSGLATSSSARSRGVVGPRIDSRRFWVVRGRDAKGNANANAQGFPRSTAVEMPRAPLLIGFNQIELAGRGMIILDFS